MQKPRFSLTLLFATSIASCATAQTLRSLDDFGARDASSTQSITFTSTAPTTAVFGSGSYTPAATASSGLPVTITIDAASTSVCAISGGVVTWLNAGTCTLDANQPGNATYFAALQVKQTFTITKASQRLSFTSAAGSVFAFQPLPYAPAAASTSGLPVSFFADSTSAGVCVNSGGLVSFIGAGSCIINAFRSGSGNYSAAPQASQVATVGSPVQTVNPYALAETYPSSMVIGPDGAPWFRINGKIARVASDGAVTEFQTALANITAITNGPDAALWFTGQACAAGVIGRFNVSTAVFTTFPIPSGSSGGAIATGPDGALWFTEPGANKIGRATTAGSITEYFIPTTNAQPSSIVAGPDGAMYFTESQKVGRISTSTGVITEFPTPTSSPGAITRGPDGNLWYGAFNVVGRVTPAGAVTEFCVLNLSNGPGALPRGITSGSDGALWFTDFNNNKIMRMTTAGLLHQVIAAPGVGATSTTNGSGASDIVMTADGNIWFDQYYDSRVVRLVPNPAAFPAGKKCQTIAFTSVAPTNATVGGTTYTPTAVASSGLSVTLTIHASSATVCRINSGVVSFVGSGACVVIATQAGDTQSNSVSISQQFSVRQVAQTVSFTTAAPVNAAVGGGSYIPAAVSTSGLPVTITVDPVSASVCGIGGGVVSFLAAGTCTLDANQAGNVVPGHGYETARCASYAANLNSVAASDARAFCSALI